MKKQDPKEEGEESKKERLPNDRTQEFTEMTLNRYSEKVTR